MSSEYEDSGLTQKFKHGIDNQNRTEQPEHTYRFLTLPL